MVVSVFGLFPVNGVHPLVELLRATELPLSEDGPENEDTADRGDNSDEDGGNVTLVLVARGGTSHRGRSGLFSIDCIGDDLG